MKLTYEQNHVSKNSETVIKKSFTTQNDQCSFERRSNKGSSYES